ncbi:MAG: T9SS type A sorting domain-containing protein [Bacteroidota bacterium]
MRLSLIITLFFIQLSLSAQIDGNLNSMPVSELDAVQTPAGTWISSSMEIGAEFDFNYRVAVHQSLDNGYTWAITDSFEVYDGYIAIGDPVMAVDTEGKPHLLFMEYVEGSSLNIHLALYVSEDEGETWQLKSRPYAGPKFSDTPHLMIDEFNVFYISYTEYDNATIDPSFVHFIKSYDNGENWTEPQVFAPVESEGVVGAYFGFSDQDQINLVYGDGNAPVTYYTKSEDDGDTWSDVTVFPNTIAFAVNKVISNNTSEDICVLTHGAHSPNSGIYCNYSRDNGSSWEDFWLVNNASMGEGLMDEEGNIHITYNRFEAGIFSVNYVHSTNDEDFFSDPIVLFTGDNFANFPLDFVGYAGESQSMILGDDDLIHLTFVDWTDTIKAKHLIFEPFNFSTSTTRVDRDEPTGVAIFPNPVVNDLNVRMDFQNERGFWKVHQTDGQELMTGQFDADHELALNVSALRPGAYLFSIYLEDQIIVKQFVKN